MIVPVVEVGKGQQGVVAVVVVDQGLGGGTFAQAEAVQSRSSSQASRRSS